MLVSSVCQRNTIMGVDRAKFRKCSDTGFCKQFRDAAPATLPRLRVDAASLTHDDKSGFLGGQLLSSEAGAQPLDFTVNFYQDGTSRLKVKESSPLRTRWEPPDVVIEANLQATGIAVAKDKGTVRVAYAGDKTLVVQLEPFQVDLLVGGVPAVTVNKGGLLHFQPYREKKAATKKPELAADAAEEDDDVDRHGGKKVVGYWEDGLAIYEDGSREEKPSVEEEEAKRRAL